MITAARYWKRDRCLAWLLRLRDAESARPASEFEAFINSVAPGCRVTGHTITPEQFSGVISLVQFGINEALAKRPFEVNAEDVPHLTFFAGRGGLCCEGNHLHEVFLMACLYFLSGPGGRMLSRCPAPFRATVKTRRGDGSGGFLQGNCGKPFLKLRNRVYCSERCARIADDEKKKEARRRADPIDKYKKRRERYLKALVKRTGRKNVRARELGPRNISSEGKSHAES